MAEKGRSSKAAVVVSIGAAVTAALALLQKRVKAAPLEPSQIVGLDEATMNLLIAIAQAGALIDSNTLGALGKLQEIIDKIGVPGIPGIPEIPSIPGVLTVQGWPPNAEGARTFAVLCVAVATAYEVPDMVIPDGMSLAIKASPLNLVDSLIFLARTPAECTNPNSAWPLVPNESITYQVTNANAFYVSTNTAGSIVLFSGEQRG